MQDNNINKELSNLYGPGWFYASFYLLMKSESREDDVGTNYFYKGGKEAADLYDMLGWNFLEKDIARRARYSRDRTRLIQKGDRKGYDAEIASEELYETEKQLAFDASRLGRFLGNDMFREKIREFILSEEQTPWLQEHREAAVEDEAFRRILAEKLGTDYRDVILLSSLKNNGTDELYISVALDDEFEAEPARFLGIADIDGQEMYLLEHLREIGMAWTGNESLLKNLKENFSHDGCLEIIMVDPEEADELYVGLNAKGSYLRARLESRCAISDKGRKMLANLRHHQFSFYQGKPMKKLKDVRKRYKTRAIRQMMFDKEKFTKQMDVMKNKILAEQDLASAEIRAMGKNGPERLTALLEQETQRRREALMSRYRKFSASPWEREGIPDDRVLPKEKGMPQERFTTKHRITQKQNEI